MREPSGASPEELTAALLAWYDRHARRLPWRAPPGQAPADPYRVWLSEVMLQQTTVAAATGYFQRFTERWPSVEALAGARDEDIMAAWAGLGYYARARNLLKCARAVAGRGFPRTEGELLELPGVGPYTAAAIASIAFGERAVVVDGNVERVMARLRAIETPLPAAKAEIRAAAEALTPHDRPGDHAQAVMDLGATICTPRSPACLCCPWREACAGRARGIEAGLPRKAPKKDKPIRQGMAWVGRRGARYILVRRPPEGLLGGTLGFPSAGWDGSEGEAPADATWRRIGAVRHSFTHFHAEISVLCADLPRGVMPSRGVVERLDPAELPTLMRKVYSAAERHWNAAGPR